MGLLGERFALQRVLRQGNGVATYVGTDVTNGASVIVKTVSTTDVSTAVRMRLEHEAHVLERLDAGGFRRLLACGQDGEVFYLVQPRLDGETLAERLEDGPLSVPSTLLVAADVLEVLVLAHDQGVLHRDIKPANIVVQGGGAVEQAELIDFGLARSISLDVSLRDEPVGTARYPAPEAAGLLELEMDQRSDLYSLGVVLFECLTGHPPFMGETVGKVLRQHLNSPAPHLCTLGIAVPRAVDGMVQLLLGKDPDARYQSAAGVLADVKAIQADLSAGLVEPAVTPGMNDRRRVLTEPVFVGRDEELRIVTRLLDGVAQGQGGVALMEAESGGGKSRLLDEIALQAQRQGVWVLRGQGVDGAAQSIFQLLDGVVNGIAAAAQDPAVAESLRCSLGDRAAAAAAALPTLAAALGLTEDSSLGPEAYGESRSIDALAALLDALGDESRPALVLLDDCQWANTMTVTLLSRWQAQKPTEGGGHVLVIAAFRSEEVLAGHPLRSVTPLQSLALAPFGAADVEALCTSMVGPLPATVLATIVRLAEGSPFMAAAVLRGMVESGALRASTDGWEVEAGPMRDVQTSRRAALFLARRFELLASSTLALLTVGAVLGKEFDLGLAVSLTGQPASEVTPALAEARRRRILWVNEDDGSCSFTHDKLRETLLGTLGPSTRSALHRQAAEWIEAADPSRVLELAYHFDAAGEHARALPYALLSAELARSRCALDEAVSHYRIAERGASASDAGLQVGIAEGLGDVLTLQGLYREASTVLGRALSLTDDPDRRAVLDGKLGDVASRPETTPALAATSKGRCATSATGCRATGSSTSSAPSRRSSSRCCTRWYRGCSWRGASVRAQTASSWPSGCTAAWRTSTGSAPARCRARGPTSGR